MGIDERGPVGGCAARPRGCRPERLTLHPTPYTLHSTPCTLHLNPETFHLTSDTLHPAPYTLHSTPKPQNLLLYIRHPSFDLWVDAQQDLVDVAPKGQNLLHQPPTPKTFTSPPETFHLNLQPQNLSPHTPKPFTSHLTPNPGTFHLTPDSTPCTLDSTPYTLHSTRDLADVAPKG